MVRESFLRGQNIGSEQESAGNFWAFRRFWKLFGLPEKGVQICEIAMCCCLNTTRAASTSRVGGLDRYRIDLIVVIVELIEQSFRDLATYFMCVPRVRLFWILVDRTNGQSLRVSVTQLRKRCALPAPWLAVRWRVPSERYPRKHTTAVDDLVRSWSRSCDPLDRRPLEWH